MDYELLNVSGKETNEGQKKNMDKKGKFVPEFNKKDPATRPKMDITNEAGYENPYVVDNILTA